METLIELDTDNIENYDEVVTEGGNDFDIIKSDGESDTDGYIQPNIYASYVDVTVNTDHRTTSEKY